MNDYVPGEKMPLWRRMYGVIWGSPGRTLEYIVRNPDFVGAGGLILAANIVLTALQAPKIREYTAWAMQNMPQELNIPAQEMEIVLTAAVASALAISAIIPPVVWLATAGLLKLFNAFTGESAEFKSVFAVTIFAYLPVLLDSIVKTVIILAGPARNMVRVTISPALFMPDPGMAPGKAYILLSHIDPFVVWSLVLTAMGASLAMKVPLWKTVVYLAALWALYVAAMTLIAGLRPLAG